MPAGFSYIVLSVGYTPGQQLIFFRACSIQLGTIASLSQALPEREYLLRGEPGTFFT